jgi:hypothetical protein
MMEWLTVNNVPFRDGMLNIQLYGLIKAHKPRHKIFVIDNITAAFKIYKDSQGKELILIFLDFIF